MQPIVRENVLPVTHLGGARPQFFFQLWARKLESKINAMKDRRATLDIAPAALERDAFLDYVQKLRVNPLILRMEWQSILRMPIRSVANGRLDKNQSKNNSSRVLPFDEHRVILRPSGRDNYLSAMSIFSSMTPVGVGAGDEEASDYINASFIDSFLEPRRYIATQGPTKKTAPDFWRMVWQERVGVIVMVTRVFDFTKVVCIEYWKPPEFEASKAYGDGYEVDVVNKEALANFIIRTITLRYRGQSRTIQHFQFLEWPMHRVACASQVLEFRRNIRKYHARIRDNTDLNGPILVHCCDGAGRTGVFITIDANLEIFERQKVIDVYGFAKQMRVQRPFMIETLEQYGIIYTTLEEALATGPVCFDVANLPAHFKWLSTLQPGEHLCPLEKEAALLERMTTKLNNGDCAGGHRTENRMKNRDVVLVPPDYARPYLSSYQSNEMADYINAVYVDGFKSKNAFIITEWPRPRTVNDIWSLIYDHDCTSVVVLASPPASPEHPPFYPTRGKRLFGPFSIETKEAHDYNNVLYYKYRIRKKTLSLSEVLMGTVNEIKWTQLFVLTCWPVSHKVPTSTTAVVELFKLIDHYRQKNMADLAITSPTGQPKPVLVVSLDGRCRAGVFCAARIACEQVKMHGECDVFHAVKTAKINRPELMDSRVEYKYCYDVVRHYIYSTLLGSAAAKGK